MTYYTRQLILQIECKALPYILLKVSPTITRAQFPKGLPKEIARSISKQMLSSRCSSTICRTIIAPARSTNPKSTPCHLFPYFTPEAGTSNQSKKDRRRKYCTARPCCTFRDHVACITGMLEHCHSKLTAPAGSHWLHCFREGERKSAITSRIL